MSKRQNSLQRPADPSIIAFVEELGRVLARREFVKMEQAATCRKSAEESGDGESCDLRPLLIRPAEPSLDLGSALCRRWCEGEGHGVVGTFYDAALSGASVHGRAGLKNLIAGAVDHRFDDIVVESFELRELIDSIVVAPRVMPGDPIHFEVRGRLAALMQPHSNKMSVGALVPRRRNRTIRLRTARQRRISMHEALAPLVSPENIQGRAR